MERGDIVSYHDMCAREGLALQKGMNFSRDGRRHTVVLMSVRPDAPYADRVQDDGQVIIYEGHDAPRTRTSLDPKAVDQPDTLPSGRLTENGLFYRAALDHKEGRREAEIVAVYEKLRQGIWAYNGYFCLTDAWRERVDDRTVFKFKLMAALDQDEATPRSSSLEHRRVIPTAVKQEVWTRDKGRCVECGSSDNLHFDHVIPFSRGGSSLTAENIQILCARHNLDKGDQIL